MAVERARSVSRRSELLSLRAWLNHNSRDAPGFYSAEGQLPALASAAAHQAWPYWFEVPRAISVTAACGRRGGKTRRQWRRRSRRREHGSRRGVAAAAAHRVGSPPSSAPPSSPSPPPGSRGLWDERRGGDELGEGLRSRSAISWGKGAEPAVGGEARAGGLVSGAGPGPPSPQPSAKPPPLTRRLAARTTAGGLDASPAAAVTGAWRPQLPAARPRPGPLLASRALPSSLPASLPWAARPVPPVARGSSRRRGGPGGGRPAPSSRRVGRPAGGGSLGPDCRAPFCFSSSAFASFKTADKRV